MSVPNAVRHPTNTRTRTVPQHLLTTATSRDNHSVPLCRHAVRGGSVRTRRDCGTARDRRRPASREDVASVLTRYTNCPLYSAKDSVSLQFLHQYQTIRRHNPPDHNMHSHSHQSPISRDTYSNNLNNSILHYVFLVKYYKKVCSPMMT